MTTSFMPTPSHTSVMSIDFFSIPSKKRPRDEDDDQVVQSHEPKVWTSVYIPRVNLLRLPQRATHSLPFRLSPTSKHTRFFSQSKRSKPKPLFTQTLTPADSEEEFSPPFSTIKGASTQAHPEGLEINDAQDLDMDMMDIALSPHREHSEDMAMVSPSASPRTLLPQQIEMKCLQDAGSTGRLPTPIYGHFQQIPQQHLTHTIPEAVTASTPPRSEKDIEYEQYLRSRRLPSPISEDEAMDFPAAPKNSPLETSAPVETRNPEPQPRGLRTPARMAQPLTGESPPKGKIMFSMGFRADCEMCRNRVPGHSNHIFRVE
jgi:hypothetical protein